MSSCDGCSSHFITPEQFESIKRTDLSGPNGWLLFVACNAGLDLAEKTKKEYEKMLHASNSSLKTIPLLGSTEEPITQVFKDTETCPTLPKNVAGSNAVVFQSLHNNTSDFTVNENIIQLLQIVRTLKAHRARTITVVTPYDAYSRQDKPTFMQREATLSSLFADLLKTAGANIHVIYHPHTLSLYGFYEPEMMLVALSGLDLFIEMFKDKMNMKDVITVSTDAGGAKFTVHYANAMNIAHAISNKYRAEKEKCNMLGIIGDLKNRKSAIIIDDETVTGSSILNAVEVLHKEHGIEQIFAAVSHMKMKNEYIPKLINAHENFGLKELHTTDTVPQTPELLGLDFVKEHSLAGIFASTVNRLHYNQSVRELFYRPK